MQSVSPYGPQEASNMKKNTRLRDPNCGMYEEKGKGLKKNGNWFCSKTCMEKYEDKSKYKCC